MSRLIDADAFEVFVLKSKGYDTDSYIAGANAILEAIDNAPTIEPKKGKWYWLQYGSLKEIGNWHCSLCNRIGNFRKTDFCPNCGADMRED